MSIEALSALSTSTILLAENSGVATTGPIS